jgi:UPF0755 protein
MARRRRTTGRKSSSGAARTLLVILLLLLLLTAAAGAWLVLAPFGPSGETFVEIAPGSSSIHIGRQLQAAGIIRSSYEFDLMRLWKHGTLKAGAYRFDQPAPVMEVYDRIQRGDTYTIAVTIPEGASMFDIAARLEQAGFGPQKKFLDVAVQQTSTIADLDPGAKSLEGYLFPDTYRFSPKETAPQIAATMVRRFRLAAAQLGLSANAHAVVTLASLVERETAVDGERPLVAGVLENRLDKEMPLMTDPSLIYGLQLARLWRGSLYESDLKRDTAYNTYLHAGLPPGPIANPGMRSLRAAMEPAKTDYLYFVAAGANPQGHSLFATTIEEHNRNVAGYRHAMKNAGER